MPVAVCIIYIHTPVCITSPRHEQTQTHTTSRKSPIMDDHSMRHRKEREFLKRKQDRKIIETPSPSFSDR